MVCQKTEDLHSLLAKWVIECGPLPNRDAGFYSRYFIVLKKDGDKQVQDAWFVTINIGPI